MGNKIYWGNTRKNEVKFVSRKMGNGWLTLYTNGVKTSSVREG